MLTVLHSLPGVRPTTNPYLVMLRDRLRSTPDLHLLDFSYRAALTGRYDVFHVHWPEILFGGAGASAADRIKKVLRQLLLVAFLLRLTLTRTPIVRTVHNLERPTGLRWHEYRLLDWIDRLTAVRIRLNEHTDVGADHASALIPHGHYRDWFADFPHPEPIGGRFGYAGLIRGYKGVETLIGAFVELPSDPAAPVSLQVAGRPSGPELAATINRLAGADPRVELELAYLSEERFAALLSSSELVVLPYRFMHNSGGALASLSLDRPVLVPDNQVNRSLSVEVGPGWVQTFEGDLDRADLLRSLAAVRAPKSPRPDLSVRDWDGAGAAHLEAYRLAVRDRSVG